MSGVLRSWNEGAARSSILDFVARVTAPEGPDFVPPPERIAVFDNDGTLWCEYPLQVQVFFTLAELKRRGAEDPKLLEDPAAKAMVAGDLKALKGMPLKDVLAPGLLVHSGMTVDEFQEIVAGWLARAKHPTTGRAFDAGGYLPQQELLEYLRANDFKTFIVTGGGIEFVRAVSERLYGIPPEQVVGTRSKYKFLLDAEGARVVKLPELQSFDDRDEKPANIALHIGRRPILAFGNSDGDLAMLRYALGGQGARLGLLLHHDDPEREFSYDRDFKLSPLREALDQAEGLGVRLVSMKKDWKAVFAD